MAVVGERPERAAERGPQRRPRCPVAGEEDDKDKNEGEGKEEREEKAVTPFIPPAKG